MLDLLPLHIWALIAGFALDLLIGDPEWFPHPVRLIGAFIVKMEKLLRARFTNLRHAAVVLTASTVCVTMAVTALILWLLSLIHPAALFIGMALISWTCLSIRNLADEAIGVARALKMGVEAGRKQVARIVGRDTASLTQEEIIKATVETVAENTTDGVLSPLIYLAIGGPILAMGFKAASTLDSMVGYRNEKYEDLGSFSAKLDDVLNYIPARITALLMCAAAGITGQNAKRALFIVRRDHANHLSPNCAWSEAAAAGALGIQLGGTHHYFGNVVYKPTIGDKSRTPEIEDIDRVNKLLYAASALALIITVVAFLLI